MKNFMNDIPGQNKVKKILDGFLDSSKVPHALLFSGPDGVGKEYHAIKFAQSLASRYADTEDLKRVIRQIGQLSEPYIKFIFPLPRGKNETETSSPTEKLTADELELIREQITLKAKNPYHKIIIPKANNIKINSVRDIKKFLSLDYRDVAKRFIIISEAHLMNEEAQNALLKNLEEPPDNVIFILCTSQIHKLRRTIISRCWRINFGPLTEEEISVILKEHFNIEADIIAAVAPFAAGSIRTALQLINKDIFLLKEKTISILRFSFGKKYYSAFEELNSLLTDKSDQDFQIVIKMIMSWINDLQKHRYDLKEFFFSNHIETLEKFNSKFPDADLNSLAVRLDNLTSLTRNNINSSLLSANLIFELSSAISKN